MTHKFSRRAFVAGAAAAAAGAALPLWPRTSFGALLDASQGRVARAQRLQPIADELGVPMAQLALAWCLGNPHVSSVLLGASRLEQLAQNLDALELLPRMDAELRQRIEAAVG